MNIKRILILKFGDEVRHYISLYATSIAIGSDPGFYLHGFHKMLDRWIELKPEIKEALK